MIVVHGNRLESLRDLVVAWMQRHPLAPLENEVILVHSNGIAQWLRLALAADVEDGGCGIAAALDIVLPSRFLWRAYRAVLGAQAVPEESPFDKPRLLWRLVRVLPEVVGQPEYAPLHRFLQRDEDWRKRFQLAERLADLFDQYQVYRADWLSAWAAGRDVRSDALGAETALEPAQRWQAALWRALLADVRGAGAAAKAQPMLAGRAAVHGEFLRCAGEMAQRPHGVPPRVIVFGVSSLPQQSLEVLAALARWTQVLVCAHNPCRHYWADIVAGRDLLRRASGRHERRPGTPAQLDDETLHLHAHPLLAAWGKQGRDYLALLDQYDASDQRARWRRQLSVIGQRVDLFVSPDGGKMLQQLQDDILELRPLHETRARWPAVDPARDTSIRFHVAHSAQREVEILHDQLLAACNADASLQPREVIVMVPDIDEYAPHIRAVFGLLDTADVRHLPFRIADQSQRRSDPLVHALEKLLALPQSRLAVSELLDLLEVPALRRRFAIDEDDLPQLRRWLRGANVRWGLHGEHRASLGLPGEGDEAARHTWLFGLRRMLLGYAVGPAAGAWQGIEPYDEIGGIDAELLGPLLALLERLEAAWRSLRQPATVSAWCQRLRRLLADFFAPADDGGNDDGARDAFTLLQLEAALQSWQQACDQARLREALPLSIVGEYWLAQLDEHRLSQRFFGGAITFATLMPMRAIPFRIVCLLGMNDGAYPRTRRPVDFDLMAADYRPGDRSRREDDRYLFLEALLSARERLYVSWVGRSVHDNSVRPPSVLVGQLREHLAAGWRLATGDGAPTRRDAGESLLAALTVAHRLQPFSADYFPLPAEHSPYFTYAHEWRGTAASSGIGGGQRANGDNAPLPPLSRELPLSLDELGEFLQRPVRAFFRQRLGVSFEADDLASNDQEPFVLDALQRWQLHDELLRSCAQALAQGSDCAAARDASLAAMQRRGDLPGGGFAALSSDELAAPLDEQCVRYQAALARWPLAGEQAQQMEEVRFAADCDGQLVEVADWLAGRRRNAAGRCARIVLETSDLVVKQQYRPERMLRHWLRHLALHLAGEPLTTVLVSKAGDVELPPLASEEAAHYLACVLHAWQIGMRRPLPLAVRAGFAWLKAATGDDEAARKTYEGGFAEGEVDRDPYLQRAYPDYAALVAGGEFAGLVVRLLAPLHAAIHAAAPAGERRAQAAATVTTAATAKVTPG